MQTASKRPAGMARPMARAAFWTAAALGTLHALWSLYWAFGGRKGWRILAWIAGPALILYGGADVAAGTAVLTGMVDVEVTDPAGLIGHAFIWGPHFALWGMALTLALWLSRRPAAP